jgi:Family of unknown function (DUF6353)
MRFVPAAVSRQLAAQALLAQKHSPSILFGVGVVSMVGSTVLACRATLKLDEVLSNIEAEKGKTVQVKELVDSPEYTGEETYTDSEMKRDVSIILVRGTVQVIKLYAPAIVVGGIGIVCLTKSHQILMDRNAALTAAFVAVDRAFKQYRARVVDRYGEDTDRDLRYDNEEVDVIDEETGKVSTQYQVTEGEHGMYARWFDCENGNWNNVPFDERNWMWLRTQQNWANDMLRSRGHLFLNEVYSMLGLAHTSAGAIVGWVYLRDNDRGDNYVDFGCWDQHKDPDRFFNGRDGAILLDFNVDGPIWQLMDELRETR